MTLLIYSRDKHSDFESGLTLFPQINELLVFDCLSDYLAFVSKPLVSGDYLSLIIIDSGSELDVLIAQRHLLKDMDIVLIASGPDQESFERFHLISPRVTLFYIPKPGAISSLLIELIQNRLQKRAVWTGGING